MIRGMEDGQTHVNASKSMNLASLMITTFIKSAYRIREPTRVSYGSTIFENREKLLSFWVDEI